MSEITTTEKGALFALFEAGWIGALDYHFSKWLCREVGVDSSGPVAVAAAFASQRTGSGHVCLDLAGLIEELAAGTGDPAVDGALSRASLDSLGLGQWYEQLAGSDLVDLGGVAGGAANTPLVLDGPVERPRLYLRRYWHHEQQIIGAIEQRLSTIDMAAGDVKRVLDLLFPNREGEECDWQKIACAVAVRGRFAIITGGPGTGKTTTVLRLLFLIQALRGGAPLRIRLAAPTGKAASRLNETIASRVAELPFKQIEGGEEIRAAIPVEVTTLHRLLGSRYASRHFIHNAANPLECDLVVVDEASMVDIGIMAALIDALPRRARLILIGDKDQLASVEAGAVLGDLCRHASTPGYDLSTRQWIESASGEPLPDGLQNGPFRPINQVITRLVSSHRFSRGGAIGRLAALVNDERLSLNERRSAIEQLFADRHDAAIDRLLIESIDDRAVDRRIEDGYAACHAVIAQPPPASASQESFDRWAADALAAFARFRLLTPLHRGSGGVDGLNRRILRSISRNGADRDGEWFNGRPVMVTRNDYSLELMNGDIGIALRLPVPDRNGQRVNTLRVAFPSADGSNTIRWVLASRLQSVETVYAMTVHKSQGSEFEHTALLLPDNTGPLLTRELIYTAITRARERFTLILSDPELLLAACAQRTERISGIAHAAGLHDDLSRLIRG